MKKYLITFLFGIIIGGITAVLIYPRPGPMPVKVIEKTGVTKKADIVAKSQTELFGKIINQKHIPDKSFGGKTESIKPVEDDCKPGEKKGDCRSICDFIDKNPYIIPLTGVVKTVYTDSTGKNIGEGTHKVTGETMLTITLEEISVKTKINDISVLAVTVPENKRPLHLGIGIISSNSGFVLEGYVQYNFSKLNILGVDIIPIAKLSLNVNHGNLFVGAEIKPP